MSLKDSQLDIAIITFAWIVIKRMTGILYLRFHSLATFREFASNVAFSLNATGNNAVIAKMVFVGGQTS